MHVSGDRASENADAVGATTNINAVGTNVCAARSSGNYLLPVGSRSRLRAYTALFPTFATTNNSRFPLLSFVLRSLKLENQPDN